MIENDTWYEDQRYKYQLNSKASHILIYALSDAEISKVDVNRSAKKMLDILALSHR